MVEIKVEEVADAIEASNDVETIRNVTPHSRGEIPHAGNGSRGAEFFPLIGLAFVQIQVVEEVDPIIASKDIETIRNVTPHSLVSVPRAGNGSCGAEFFPLIGLAFVQIQVVVEDVDPIIASKDIETIRNVTPHSRVSIPRAGNGSCGAEFFPLIGLAIVEIQVIEAVADVHAAKDIETIRNVTPHSRVSIPCTGNGSRGAEFFPLIGLAFVQIQVIEVVGAIIACKDVETICNITPHSRVYAPRTGNGSTRAEFFPLIGLAFVQIQVVEVVGVIIACKDVEAIRNVTPHSRVCAPRAGNGSCGAECFPLIGLSCNQAPEGREEQELHHHSLIWDSK